MGPSLPQPQCGLVPSAKFLLVRHAFIYIHFPVLCGSQLSAEGENSAKLPHKFYPPTVSHPDFQLLSQTAHVRFPGRKCTHSPLLKGSHTAAYTAKQGPSGRGRYHCPRHVLHVYEHPRVGYQSGVLCRFWVLAGSTPEGRRKPAGQRCAYARRCPEASRPRWAA